LNAKENFLYVKGKISVSGGVEKKVQKKSFWLVPRSRSSHAPDEEKNNFSVP
jgi:hypothetical protein